MRREPMVRMAIRFVTLETGVVRRPAGSVLVDSGRSPFADIRCAAMVSARPSTSGFLELSGPSAVTGTRSSSGALARTSSFLEVSERPGTAGGKTATTASSAHRPTTTQPEASPAVTGGSPSVADSPAKTESTDKIKYVPSLTLADDAAFGRPAPVRRSS